MPGQRYEHWAANLFPKNLAAKLAFLFAGVILPCICFVMVLGGSPDGPDWQSGNLNDFAGLLLDGRTHRLLYPFLAYSMISLCLVLFGKDASRFFAVRCGLYLGVITAAIFSWTMAVTLGDVAGAGDVPSIITAVFNAFLGTISPWLVWMFLKLLAWLWRKIPKPLLPVGIIMAVMALTAIILFGPVDDSLEILIAVPIVVSLICASYWALLVYSSASFRVMAEHRRKRAFSLFQLLGVFTGIATYLAAWRSVVSEALEIYAALPTEPPGGCFVATAAARGHSSFVGSAPRYLAGGQLLVNDQMAYLKSGEIALRAMCPRLHRPLRRAYNHVGPKLAARIRNPWLADVAYLVLKPAELLTRVALSMLVDDDMLCRSIYGRNGHD